MMAVSYTDGVLHSVTTPTPSLKNSDDWLLFLNELLPTMNRFLPGLPWRLQQDRCVLLDDNAPIHSAEADAFIRVGLYFSPPNPGGVTVSRSITPDHGIITPCLGA